MPAFTEKLKVDGQDMDLYASIPKGSGPFPAVVVAMHGAGLDDFVKSVCDRLAAEGFVAVAPDKFHRTPPGSLKDGSAPFQHLKDPEVIADFTAAVNFLVNHKAIDKDRIGITGFCSGGRVSWLMAAAASQHIKAAAIYHGGNIFVKWGNPERTPFERTNEIKCPVLFHFGEIDQNPSQDDMKKLDAELKRLGKPHEFYTYPVCGHSFTWREDPQGRYNQAAAELSWPRTVEFFNTHLKEAAGKEK